MHLFYPTTYLHIISLIFNYLSIISIGSYTGGTFGKHVGNQKLQYGFAGVMAVLGSRTLLQAMRKL
jgi:uncharacterized membrane protein YfcA